MSSGPAAAHEEGAVPAEVAHAPEALDPAAGLLEGAGGLLAGAATGRRRLTPGSVLALQRTAGNRAVTDALGHARAGPGAIQRITDEQLDARSEPRQTGSDADRIVEAMRTHDIGTIKEIDDFSGATDEQRLQFIRDLLNQTWVGPRDEYALERIWNSIGPTRLSQVAGANFELWSSCIDRGAELVDIEAARGMRASFETDVKALAHRYMDDNLQFTNREFQRLGLEQGTGPQSPTAGLEADLAVQETQDDMRRARALLQEQDALRHVVVGHESIANPGAPGTVDIHFDPTQRPQQFATPGIFILDPDRAEHTWDETKRHWDEVASALAGITARSPTVYAAVASGRENVDAIATQTPAQARAVAQQVLTMLRSNINETIPKLDSGELDWRDLVPIHQQLTNAQAHGASGVDWSTPFGRSVVTTVIGDHQTHEFWVSLGLGTLAAALFIVAEFATAGLATGALIGAGIGIGAGQAVNSWNNWETLSTAAGSAATQGTQLVSQGQADAAEVEAIINTVAVFLDIASPLAHEAGAALRAGRIAEAVTERSAATALVRAAQAGPEAFASAEGRQLIERGVVELGVQETASRTGKTAQELLAIVGDDSRVADRLRNVAQTPVAPAGGAAAGGTAAAGGRGFATTAANAAEEAFLSGGPLAELVGGVPGAVQAGRLSRGTAEKLIQEAIDRVGPLETVKRAGWRDLSQALGAESVAGGRLMQWRDAIFDDLERYAREELHGEVQRTGTVKNFTNDIDMSFTGATSAATKEQAAQYLARRLGTDDFQHVMMADLFTDPRRMHIYDVLPAAIRERVAARTAAHQEQLIWNRRLFDAVESGNAELAESIRGQMRSMNIAEFAYRPLSEANVARLSERLDALHAQLDQAIRAGDVPAQERLAEEIGDAQALVNATGGGGYFSGGGVRRYVSERPGEPGFARPPGAPAGVPDVERLTAMIDQLPKLDHAAEQLAETLAPEEVQAGIRGIGKYGGRLSELSGEAGAADSVWERLAAEARRLKEAADHAGTSGARGAGGAAAESAETLTRDAGALLDDLIAKSQETITRLRQASGISSIPQAAERIQQLTLNHVRLLRAADALRRQLSLIARALRTGVNLNDLERDADAAAAALNPTAGPGDFPTPSDSGGSGTGTPAAGDGSPTATA